MISCAISRLVIVCFGTLYPAYASYKAVKTKNVKEYVKWMMYWIVFALFTCAETFTDVFLSFWFPFYYEIKILLVLWLLSPATKGSSFLYRKFVHPQLAKREKDIDEYLNRAKEQGYHAVLQLGTKGINYASQVLVQTALKGSGHIVNQLHRSYSMADLHSPPPAPLYDEVDGCVSDENDTAAEEDSLPLDDFSGRQSFPSVSKMESESQLRRRDSGNGSSVKVDEPSSGYASSDKPDNEPKKNRTTGKTGVKRTKSTPNSIRIKEIGNTYEIGSSATLPRTSKRINNRRKNLPPIN